MKIVSGNSLAIRMPPVASLCSWLIYSMSCSISFRCVLPISISTTTYLLAALGCFNLTSISTNHSGSDSDSSFGRYRSKTSNAVSSAAFLSFSHKTLENNFSLIESFWYCLKLSHTIFARRSYLGKRNNACHWWRHFPKWWIDMTVRYIHQGASAHSLVAKARESPPLSEFLSMALDS